MNHDFPRPKTFAFTLRLQDAASDLLTQRIALLRDCVALAQQRFGLTVGAASVLPAEVQMMVSAGTEDAVRAGIGLIRSSFARHAAGAPAHRVWEVADAPSRVPVSAMKGRAAFILAAPVRAGLAARPEDWPYSSLHSRGAPRPAAVA